MRNKRLIIALLAAITFGLIAAVSVKQYLLSAKTFEKSLNDVVVAKVDIPVGTRLIPEQLTVAQFPANVTPEGAIPAIDENLIGRVVTVSLSPRDPVTDAKLAPIGAAGGLSSMIPEGYRAMTVAVNEVVGVSGFIMPGTLVDVVVVILPPAGSGQEGMISKIVLQNIKVLASGQNIDKPNNAREVERSIRAVTLQVTPEQAEKLALASSEGKLQLVMRNSVDQADEQTTGANKRTLLSGERATIAPEPGSATPPKTAPSSPIRRTAPKPVRDPNATAKVNTPAPPPRPSVEVIKGAKKETVDFPQ
ncbi:MAG TPA: Flp pilus assembly protein CpaB [Blastocatellia bacterium]|jgi:pilus assembly protein CpaB|nr:Flp pilus assembly protein CpaB [Blastocatellia bacterium]